LQNFSNLRVMRMVSPGRISPVTGKELSAVLAECAARTEIARAGVEEARKGIEEDRRKHEAVMAKHEAAVAKQEEATEKQEGATKKAEEAAAEQRARLDERWAEAGEWWEENARKTDAILIELQEARDERRALIEALFRVMDRLDRKPPPPPNLRSV
jgi:hypothetical protein